jgi:hypothetical protein
MTVSVTVLRCACRLSDTPSNPPWAEDRKATGAAPPDLVIDATIVRLDTAGLPTLPQKPIVRVHAVVRSDGSYLARMCTTAPDPNGGVGQSSGTCREALPQTSQTHLVSENSDSGAQARVVANASPVQPMQTLVRA